MLGGLEREPFLLLALLLPSPCSAASSGTFLTRLLPSTETAIIVLDCIPMLVVILLLNVTHPLYTVDPLVNRYRSTPTEERGATIQLGRMSRSESADKWLGVSSRIDRSSV